MPFTNEVEIQWENESALHRTQLLSKARPHWSRGWALNFGLECKLKLWIFGFHSSVCQCGRSDHNAVRCSTWLDFSFLGIIPIGIYVFILNQPGFTTWAKHHGLLLKIVRKPACQGEVFPLVRRCSGVPGLARPPRPGPCLDFGFQLRSYKKQPIKKIGVENWALPGSNSQWRLWIPMK